MSPFYIACPTTDFYDALASRYHLLFGDWPASVARQGQQLAALAARQWPQVPPRPLRVLDVACGIGTQALGLAQLGHAVTASDLSEEAVARGRREAMSRGLAVDWSVADMRAARAQHGSGFDLVVCADNSLPHLLTEADIRLALREMHDTLVPGGGCLITLRDYANEPRGRGLFKPYEARELEGGGRVVMFQVWDFEPRPDEAGRPQADLCRIALYMVEDSPATGEARTQVMRAIYHAVSIDTLMQWMCEAGFTAVQRHDGVFYQPVLTGTRAA